MDGVQPWMGLNCLMTSNHLIVTQQMESSKGSLLCQVRSVPLESSTEPPSSESDLDGDRSGSCQGGGGADGVRSGQGGGGANSGEPWLKAAGWSTVTLGAPSAHKLGFAEGGAIALQRRLLKLATHSEGPDGKLWLRPSEAASRLGVELGCRRDFWKPFGLDGCLAVGNIPMWLAARN